MSEAACSRMHRQLLQVSRGRKKRGGWRFRRDSIRSVVGKESRDYDEHVSFWRRKTFNLHLIVVTSIGVDQ